ncbi:acyl-CoA reductase [Flavilitoribacter nigricans]|uniref:Acyl-CoA reductase n=1 Tax=Flavilitoribacter nigricans (strain ATCC 23147 / DSM 23189 / NBRC 102662 / NCIMB 1420 / SS-2) TaxID=1122177 RepID=A0A2D0NDB8_FLAN2|nr:acyl-CoA reductase [Flavilitoribacter nigricans]PHN06467.1 acyl-CoA reductase [Flavilitoribacter nigricans DSM 23189 = NBRC 102662]
MNLNERLDALVKLGESLRGEDEYREAVIHRTAFNNPWFTKENQRLALEAISTKMLDKEKLDQWLDRYEMHEPENIRSVGMVLAGNIPLVGFHDVLCVFVAGHHAVIKLSDKDPYLLPFLLKRLNEIDERTAAYFRIVEQLKDFDAVIATGSNNSARYFESYFGKYPNIIRKNRNAVAVLNGAEDHDELMALGKDVFRYFGLGCRNVAKLYVPEGYDFDPLLTAFHEYRDIITHSKYKNNFDYNYALFMLNKVPYRANGCIILTENPNLQSHIAGLHYEYYDSEQELVTDLKSREEEIQCVVSKMDLEEVEQFPFGKAQEPELWDYADGVDTMKFLLDLD